MSELVLEQVWSEPLKGVSLRASAGLSVVLGAESDGSAALVALCAGVRAPRRGRVTVDAEAPSRSPRCRRGIASLLATEAPLAGGDVRGWLDELSALRGVSPAAVLASCTLAGDRPLRSLSSAERRELACWVALAQTEPALVVLHDPLSACGAGRREQAIARITELGRTTTVLLVTPSIAEARVLGGSRWRLDRGLLESAPEGAAGDEPRSASSAWHGVAGACLAIEADAARALASALAQQPDVHELRYDEHGSGRLWLRGADLERLAQAVARAVVSTETPVRSLRAGADDLDALRAATTAMNDAAGAAYRAARARGLPASAEAQGPEPAASDLKERAALAEAAATPERTTHERTTPERTAPAAPAPGAERAATTNPPEPPGSTPSERSP